MPVSEKTQKTRLYKVAKELNLSHDTLIEFLTKKGYDIKNHMSILDEEMLGLVERHFRKDKAEAERHARKRREFDEQDRKRRGEDEESPVFEQQPQPAETARITAEVESESVVPTTAQIPAEVPAVADVKPPATPAEAPVPVSDQTEAPPITVDIEEAKKPEAESKIAGTPAEIQPPVVEAIPPVESKPVEVEKVEEIPEQPAAAAPQQEIETALVTEEKPVEAEIERPPVKATRPPKKTAADKPGRKEAKASTEPASVVTAEPQTPAPKASAQKADESMTGADSASIEAGKKPDADVKKEDFDVSIGASVPKMGLTVRGKIDLQALKEQHAKAERGKDATEKADEKPKHKKKKKKKIASGVPETTEESADSDRKKTAAKRGKKGKTKDVDAGEVADAIKRTIAAMGDYGPVSARSQLRRKKRARREEEQRRESERVEIEKRTLKIYEYASVSEIASLMNVSVTEIISSLIGLGVMASINQRLDLDTITLVASEFGFEVQHVAMADSDALEDTADEEEELASRPPIVTIMGHVDHGKTSLLDYIRKTNVVAGESGGITQHIGAYTVDLSEGRKITFLDTPGHEAFTAMRARGAQATDIVVLVVSADDSVMPQTVEAISHAQAAKVPIVVAINKIDKPAANIERIKQQLAERNILVEDWGGRYGAVPISAKLGTNVEQLLERILLEAELLNLKANYEREARGVVLESRLDKKGIVATVLVQKGTLSVGDAFVAGNEFGRVRSLADERDNKVSGATPSTPVQVLGFNGMPQAGDLFVVVESDRDARLIASQRQQLKRESDFRSQRRKTLDDISAQIKLGGVEELSLIVKADVDGSVEALSDALEKLSRDEVGIRVIHAGVGAISESDVLLASASDAIIIGFRVRPNLNARKLAETETVDIRLYDIIYDAIDDVKQALEGLLQPEVSEKILATILVREIFRISKVGTIAGCYVQEGKIHRNNRVRLLRDGMKVFTGNIDSLKRFKDDVREVDTNFECGISLDGFNDIKVGDIIEAFERVETKRTLA